MLYVCSGSHHRTVTAQCLICRLIVFLGLTLTLVHGVPVLSAAEVGVRAAAADKIDAMCKCRYVMTPQATNLAFLHSYICHPLTVYSIAAILHQLQHLITAAFPPYGNPLILL